MAACISRPNYISRKALERHLLPFMHVHGVDTLPSPKKVAKLPAVNENESSGLGLFENCWAVRKSFFFFFEEQRYTKMMDVVKQAREHERDREYLRSLPHCLRESMLE